MTIIPDEACGQCGTPGGTAASPRHQASTVRIVVALVVVIPLGFAAKRYAGPAHAWVNDSLSGVFYEVFWCLLGALALPRTRHWVIAGAVFVATSTLEFTQLWHPPFLQAIRRSFVGVTVVGDTFVPTDFIYYAIGCVASWGLIRRLVSPTSESA